MSAWYPIEQCALYKLRSKGRLCTLLGLDPTELRTLCEGGSHYKIFNRRAQVCPFTGKKIKERLVEEPKPQLKLVQARVRSLLSRVVPPAYAYGGVKGRSYRTNAALHTGDGVAATFDVTRFFPSTHSSRVYDFFKDRLRCEVDISAVLTRLCTFSSHLPTGSPTSPILSVYANKAMFDELAAYAIANDLTFSVYVDDISFSGHTIPADCTYKVASVLAAHGHSPSHGKSKRFTTGMPRIITGVIVCGDDLRVPHSRFKKARAIETAFRASTDASDRLKLAQKLAGLLGEAASIDPSYSAWAQASYAKLAAARS